MAVPIKKLNVGEADETHFESASAVAKKRMRGQIAPSKRLIYCVLQVLRR